MSFTVLTNLIVGINPNENSSSPMDTVESTTSVHKYRGLNVEVSDDNRDYNVTPIIFDEGAGTTELSDPHPQNVVLLAKTANKHADTDASKNIEDQRIESLAAADDPHLLHS